MLSLFCPTQPCLVKFETASELTYKWVLLSFPFFLLSFLHWFTLNVVYKGVISNSLSIHRQVCSSIIFIWTNKNVFEFDSLNFSAHLSPQTPTLLLTPSPLLSNIHFWSTLSPVAPLSPATRRQGAHLFQVNMTKHHMGHSINSHSFICLSRPYPSFFSVLVSVSTHTSIPDPCSQYGRDQHSWSHFARPSEDIGLVPRGAFGPRQQNHLNSPQLFSIPHKPGASKFTVTKFTLQLDMWSKNLVR